jgi:hypothetical protein
VALLDEPGQAGWENGSRLLVDHKTNRHGTRCEYFIGSGQHERRTPCKQRALPIDVVEDLVEEPYRLVQLGAELAAVLQQLRAELSSASICLLSSRHGCARPSPTPTRRSVALTWRRPVAV